ncbi:ABC transporter permease [Sulfuriflexus mobilis]|uniref:ABC transporter permease n=1 Tax=Sulfuriflexus mobilis TaxID=1811807 RepID=UPI000F826E57|nr:ABC transporter permease subunit [Sulfuriflexus mobilis]
MNAILIVANKEFRDGLRNRWVLSITLVFAFLAIGLAYFGASASGTVGFTSLATTIISLSSLAIFLIPLIALLLAYDSIIGEDEQGTLLLLLTYPMRRSQLLLGKFMGHAGIMGASTVLGFGVSAVLIGILTDEIFYLELWQAFGVFILTTTLLGWVFIAMAYVISSLASEKSRAAGISLILWFWFVLIFDLILLGQLVLTKGASGNDWLAYLLLLNPTDVFRLANLASFEAARNYTGLAHMTASGSSFDSLMLTGVLVAWVIVPLLLALWLFNRRRI